MDTNEFLQRLPTDQSYRDARFAIEYATRMQDESQLEHDAALVDEEVRAARTIEDLDAVHGLLAIAGFMAIAGMTLEGPDHARKILALHSLRDQYARISGEFVELESIAHQDHLTGRLNRHGMYAWAKKHYKPQENSYGVFFLDFEKFKTINDILGHRVGDTTLRDAIDYISTKIRTGHKKPNDVISVEDRRKSQTSDIICLARYGGDEIIFVVDLNGAEHEDAQIIVEAITGRLNSEKMKASSIDKPGKTVDYGFRVGSILTGPHNPLTFDEAIQIANNRERALKESPIKKLLGKVVTRLTRRSDESKSL